MYNNVFFLFLFFVVFCVVTLSFFFVFLVASFDGLRPILVTCHCSLCSLANKLRSFVRSFVYLFHCGCDYKTNKTSAADAGGECDASCVTDGALHCWGAGPDMCQTRKILFSRCNVTLSLRE